MATNRTYTDDDKGRVFFSLTVNQGNVKRTARETNVPVSTIRSWRREWEKNGPSKEVALAAEQDADDFVPQATRIRDKALLAFEKKIDTEDVSARDLMTGVGILSDKLHTARGLQKKTTTEQAPGLEREIAKELVKALQQSQEREIVIDATEADWEQSGGPKDPKGLPSPEEE